MPPAAQGLRVALIAALLTGAAVACQGADPYYRHRADGGHGGSAGIQTGGAGTFGFAGTSGAAGTGAAGIYGFAGTSGAAGTTGAAGVTGTAGAAGVTGAGGTAAPCTTCMVKVTYTCREPKAMDASQASFVLDVTNESSTPIALSSLTLRYWYTLDAGAGPQVLECDFAKLACSNLVTSADATGPQFVAVMPPKPTANEYVEIAFKPGALDLSPFLDTGEIQLRLHNKDTSIHIDQMDDWSFNPTMSGTPIDGTKITAYVDGVLVWGTEPQ